MHLRRHRHRRPLRNQGPRRNADRHPRRADAPRRLRSPRLAPRGHLPARRRRHARSSRCENALRRCPERKPRRHPAVASPAAKPTSPTWSINPHSVTVQAVIPTRGLIGFETDLVNATKGHGIMSHLFKEYGAAQGRHPHAQQRRARHHGRRHLHRLRARHDPGARPPLHRPAGGNLRRHDRRRKRPPRRHARESLPREKAHQHALAQATAKASPSRRRSR